MKKIIGLILGLLLITGCIPVLIGAGLVTGYSLSTATASGNVTAEYRVLWDLCLDELETMEAEILSSNESKGAIKAKVSEHSIAIKVVSISTNTQRLKVTARQLLMPKAQFAQKIFLKLISDLQ
ncbi:MAG: hypothetical protein HQ570_02930 [Candidatus Omnitrophica bacterium]|nr:hypothetical protein [Candidatus Omnitrophota bacterium]